MDYSKAEREALRRITPPKKKPAVIAQTLKRVDAELKRRQLAATVHVGGSLAKGTYLKGDHDVDVFVRFATHYADAEISERLEAALVAAFGKRDVERVHGSRDYFHVQRGAFTFEFIPVLHVSSWSEARNVTDMSPLHVAYVEEKIAKRPSLAGDIRLTKLFCKAAKVYGAESYIGGFSGHVIDILNIHYGGFHKLLEAAAAWPAKVVIDPEQRLDNPMTQLNDAKTYSPLVIVDPIQQDRNSAAAVTEHAFKKFRLTAKEYLATKPTEQEKFFAIVPLTAKDLKVARKDADIIQVSIVSLRGKKDVVGSKCYKVYQYCVQQLVDNGFSLLESRWEFVPNRALLVFALVPGLLPAEQEIIGPPVHKQRGVAGFSAVHKTTFTRGGVMYAVEKRKWRDARKLLAAVLKDKYVTSRVKSASVKA